MDGRERRCYGWEQQVAYRKTPTLAMLWVILAAVALFVLAPPVVALVEGWTIRSGPRDVGFWALARSVAGSCHVRWGRGGSPVVRFRLPAGEGRARAVRSPGRRGWLVEVRCYQSEPFGFSARLCLPTAPAARWRAPGLRVMDLFPEEREHLTACSLETTDERLLRWLLRHQETRQLLDGLREAATARAVEIILSGTVIVVRGAAPTAVSAGGAMELLGPPLVEALRALSSDLDDLATALIDVGDELATESACPGCCAELDEDPWVCPDCETALHRGCREMLGGCSNPRCQRAPDALPGFVVQPPDAFTAPA